VSAPAFEPRRFGAYTLEARLGHGGMAEVFRANREGVAGFARTCVVKRILGHHNEDPSFVDMFINEAKIASKLTHPNIVQVYELGQVDGEFFIAMEYVKGKDLLRILRELAQTRANDPAIPSALAAYIARETCRALQHAHDHSDERGNPRPIIHRDISPQNIMISYDGMVKLVDFGIAKALGSMREETRTGALKGKFAYMAPEQVAGQSPGPSADVFSTGVVLHEMLTGRRLFKGTSDYDTLNKVRTMVVPAPSTLNQRVPAELDTIVARSLERDRNTRYQKAAQMARDLDGYLQTVRFSVEEMAEYMRALFPAEPNDPPNNENITKEYLISKSRTGASRSSSRAEQRASSRSDSTPVTGSGMMPRGSYSQGARSEGTPSGTGGRRAVFVAFGLAALVGTGTVFLVGGKKQAPEAAVGPVADVPRKAIKKPDAPEVVQLPDETRVVKVRSEPTGARVFEGPRLLGPTPVELRLPVDSPGVTLTLVREGRMDLTYLVRPGDAPEITLRLLPTAESMAPPPTPAMRHVRPVAHPAPRPTKPQPFKPKVEIFDDTSSSSSSSPRPKVDALDD
jgi:eukaryotic-like serine/threonine-protein kinase